MERPTTGPLVLLESKQWRVVAHYVDGRCTRFSCETRARDAIGTEQWKLSFVVDGDCETLPTEKGLVWELLGQLERKRVAR